MSALVCLGFYVHMYMCLCVCVYAYVGSFPWLVPNLDHTPEAVPVEGGGLCSVNCCSEQEGCLQQWESGGTCGVPILILPLLLPLSVGVPPRTGRTNLCSGVCAAHDKAGSEGKGRGYDCILEGSYEVRDG